MLAAVVIGALTIATAISLSGGAPQFQKLPEMLKFGLVVALANTSLALLAVSVMWVNLSAVLLLLIPLVTIFLAYRAYLSEREKHSALLDCRLLAAVYVELVGGHQARLDFAVNGAQSAMLGASARAIAPRPRTLAPRLTAAEIEAHRAFVATLGAEALWLRY